MIKINNNIILTKDDLRSGQIKINETKSFKIKNTEEAKANWIIYVDEYRVVRLKSRWGGVDTGNKISE